MSDEPYVITSSDEDNSMHLSKDGGPTICTDFHSSAPLDDFVKLCEDANNGYIIKKWAEQKLAICNELDCEEHDDSVYNEGYSFALIDILNEIKTLNA